MGCRSAESLSSPPGLLQASGVWWRWRHWENKGQCLTFGAAPSLPCLPCVDFPPPPLAQQPPLRSSPGPPEFLPRHHVEGPSGPSPHLTRTTFTRSSGKLQPHPCRAGWRCTVWPLMCLLPPLAAGSPDPLCKNGGSVIAAPHFLLRWEDPNLSPGRSGNKAGGTPGAMNTCSGRTEAHLQSEPGKAMAAQAMGPVPALWAPCLFITKCSGLACFIGG